MAGFHLRGGEVKDKVDRVDGLDGVERVYRVDSYLNDGTGGVPG